MVLMFKSVNGSSDGYGSRVAGEEVSKFFQTTHGTFVSPSS